MPVLRTEICREHLDAVRCAVPLERLRHKTAAEDLQPTVDFFLRIHTLERTFRRRADGLSAFSAHNGAPNEEVMKCRTRYISETAKEIHKDYADNADTND